MSTKPTLAEARACYQKAIQRDDSEYRKPNNKRQASKLEEAIKDRAYDLNRCYQLRDRYDPKLQKEGDEIIAKESREVQRLLHESRFLDRNVMVWGHLNKSRESHFVHPIRDDFKDLLNGHDFFGSRIASIQSTLRIMVARGDFKTIFKEWDKERKERPRSLSLFSSGKRDWKPVDKIVLEERKPLLKAMVDLVENVGESVSQFAAIIQDVQQDAPTKRLLVIVINQANPAKISRHPEIIEALQAVQYDPDPGLQRLAELTLKKLGVNTMEIGQANKED